MLELTIAAALLGFSPILVKAIALGPTLIAFYRCAFGALFILPVLLISNKPWLKTIKNWQTTHLILAAGLFFALDLLVWHRSIQAIGAGLGTLLANTQAIYLAVYSAIIAKEKVPLKLIIAIGLTFLGLYLIVDIQTYSATLDQRTQGILWGLAAGLCYSSFIIIFKKINGHSGLYATMANIFWVSVISALFLLGFSQMGHELALPMGYDWLWLTLLALIVHFIAWLIILKNIAIVPLALAGLILMLQPALAMLLGKLIFNEVLTWHQGVGTLLTLVGVYLGSTTRKGLVD